MLKKHGPFITGLTLTAVFFAAIGFTDINIPKGPQKPTIEQKNALSPVDQKRVAFAREHGAIDPEGLINAAKDSPIADLLISLAIEESHGDVNAIGDAGEEGAFQVIASDWGPVPKDLAGQCRQAEKIVLSLMEKTEGNKKQALAHYNGGSKPRGTSYNYAGRILKRVFGIKC